MEAAGTATAVSTPNRLRDLKTSARELIMMRPQDIHIEDGHNPRDYTLPENRRHLDELKNSIRENGTLSPLLVRWDGAQKKGILVDGECRLRANLELIAEGVEILAVPVVQVQAGNEIDRLVIALTANTGKPLSKWESGTAFKRLVNFGWSPEQIANKLGFTLRFVTESLELSDAPQEVKEMLSQQAVTPSLALQEMRQNGSAAVENLKAAAAKAQSEGKKTATRSKGGNPINTQAVVNQIVKILQSTEGEIFEDGTGEDFKWVEVEKVQLRKLANLIGFTPGKDGKKK